MVSCGGGGRFLVVCFLGFRPLFAFSFFFFFFNEFPSLLLYS